MTSTAVDPFHKTARSGPRDPQWTSFRVGQVVAAQAAIAGLLAALGHGPIILTAASAICAAVVIVAFVRVRGRWLHSWLAVGIRYTSRRHSLPAHATPAELMRFLAPDVATSPGATFVDADGLVTVFELAGLIVASEPAPLPDLAGLMDDANDPRRKRSPSAVDDPPQRGDLLGLAAISPLVRIELLVTVAAAPASWPGNGTAASYRQLTGNRVPAIRRTFVVLRVLCPPGWSDADLRPTMSAATRRVAKRLGPHWCLDHDDAAATLAQLAHHDGTSSVDERWSFVVIGGLCQAAYRVGIPSGDEHTARAVQRLLTLPTAATTISVSPSRPGQVLAIRLAAGSPQQLERADHALRQLAAAEQASVRRLDGQHRIATAETLLVGGQSGSLGLGPPGSRSTRRDEPGQLASKEAADGVRRPRHPAVRADAPRPRPSPRPRRRQHPPGPHPGPGPAPRTFGEPTRPALASAVLAPAGLVVGYDRDGIPVVAQIFRPAQTRVVVVGGVGTAQLIALRALALGALIDVRTRRWAAWSSFADDVAAPMRNIAVTPDLAAIPSWATPAARDGSPGWVAPTTRDGTPGAARPDPEHTWMGAPGTPLRPTLTIVDAATRALGAARRPSPADESSADRARATPEKPGRPAARWHTILTVRDELTSADTQLLTAADLVVLQALSPDEANLVADAFRLEGAAGYLTGLSDEMVALVGSDQPLRWATLATTPVERSYIPATPSDIDALQPVTRAGNSARGGD